MWELIHRFYLHFSFIIRRFANFVYVKSFHVIDFDGKIKWHLGFIRLKSQPIGTYNDLLFAFIAKSWWYKNDVESTCWNHYHSTIHLLNLKLLRTFRTRGSSSIFCENKIALKMFRVLAFVLLSILYNSVHCVSEPLFYFSKRW